MLAERPAAGIGGALLNRFNLADEEVVKDLAHQFRRCSSPEAFEVWAKTWAPVIIDWLQTVGVADSDQLEEAQEAANKAEADLSTLRAVAESVLKEFDAVAVDLPDEPVNRLNDILAKLENAL